MKDLSYNFSGLDQRARGTIVVLAYTLLAGKTVTVNANVLTEGVDFTAATSNAATATSLASAINALANVNATASTATVTIHADAPGTAGNAYNLLTNATTAALTLSGATLSGGVAETYSDVLELAPEEGACVETSLVVTALTGVSGNVTVRPQYSYDKVTWLDDVLPFTTLNASTTLPFQESRRMTYTGLYVRFKLVTSGVVSSVTGTIWAKASEYNGTMECFPNPQTGELAGVTSATQLPNIPCKMFKIVTDAANTGSVAIGRSTVTLPDGTSDITSGLTFGADVDSGWIPCQNMNQFWRKCSGTGDKCTFLAMA